MRSNRGRARTVVAAAFAATVAVGCGPAGDDETLDADIAISTPRALQLDCANPPADLRAELWVSGSTNACELTVDVAAGTTSGTCPTSRGFVRSLTLSWFVERQSPGGQTVHVVLAQVRGQIDLSGEPAPPPLFGTAEPEVADWTINADAISLSECVDASVDPVNGTPTIVVDGVDVPVCDLDASCASDAEPACTNLGQVCAGLSPFGI